MKHKNVSVTHKQQCYHNIGSPCVNLVVPCSSSSHRCHSGRSFLFHQHGISHIWCSGTAAFLHHHQTDGTPNMHIHQILHCTPCIYQPATGTRTSNVHMYTSNSVGMSRHTHSSTALSAYMRLPESRKGFLLTAYIHNGTLRHRATN